MKIPHWPVPLGHKPIVLGLERVRALLSNLGSPHHSLPPVVHVAGTNGKGSTIAFLKSILESAGYKVHVYTSPHLVNFNERIILAGNEIEDEYLTEVLDECKKAAQDSNITFFEGTTAAALLAFSRVDADVLLLETGLGGRLDATNVIDKPALTIITPISFDHTDFLGSELSKIAYEKVSIMKGGVPCVVSNQSDNVMKVIKNHAKKKNVQLLEYEKTDFPLGLEGGHQIINAGTAITAAKHLFSVSEKNIKKGLLSVKWAGRLQNLTKGKLVDILSEGTDVWVDGGHNEAAGIALGEKSTEWVQPLYIIVGMLKGKDCKKFLLPLAERVSFCYGVTIPDESCISAEEIVCNAEKIGMNAEIANSVEEAVANVPPFSRILICGSLYLAGIVLSENS